ncbi:chromate transporter [Sphingomonas sp. Root710]|uniref:chromate efflux transporter n=1 Tax=Sphingomonas sp. Root710 TaxID=1736594 RepID=UPI0006FEC31F|nr:chromate efflux transporter [Sphingomonas sp. Root710]KRB82817.1 chromate transporter [Sphingomonas sp. Root710]
MSEPHGIGFGEALRVWTRIALLSFGGPAGQIAVMHRILVDEKKWIGEERFLHALNFCMMLPGPEAQQLATYIGWLLHRIKGGLAAGILFVLPGMIAIMALSWLYILAADAPPVAAMLFGIKAAVVAIVFQAVFRIGRRALGNSPRRAVAAAAFLALFLFQLPFPLVVLTAGLGGWLAERAGVTAFAGGGHGAHHADALRDADSALGAEMPDHARQGPGNLAATALILLALWLAPVALLIAFAPADSAFAPIATFFSKMAMLTFGGAYAVLAWVGQAAVEQYHWMTPGEMLDGLGLAESTPGPLIIVTQYVGFLAAYRHPGGLDPLLAGTLGGLLTTWVTFVPCFLWIFLGAPFIERLRHNAALASALATISAAVVGVILNLACWFALHYWFAQVQDRRWGPFHLPLPDPASIDWPAAILSAAALIAMIRFGRGVLTTLAGCALAGLAVR